MSAKKRRQQIPSHPLRGHHTRLVTLLEGLVAEAKKDDRSKLRPMWATFESALLAHINAEEAELLPPYRRGHPVEAQAIEEDHRFFRKTLVEFGVDLDLHLMKASAVETFGRRLRAHAASEDRELYPWAKRALPPEVLARFRRIAEGEPAPAQPSDAALEVGMP